MQRFALDASTVATLHRPTRTDASSNDSLAARTGVENGDSDVPAIAPLTGRLVKCGMADDSKPRGQKLASVRQVATGRLYGTAPPAHDGDQASYLSSASDGSEAARSVWDEAIWDQAVWGDGSRRPTHLPGGGDGGDPPDDNGVAAGELPDGDPRGIDGVADWDSMASLDDAPAQTLHATSRHDNESMIFPASIKVDPPLPRVAHTGMVKRIEALEAKLKEVYAPGIGHNGPPSPIDTLLTPAQVAAILHETEKLRRNDPAPQAVPDEAKDVLSLLRKYRGLIAVAVAAGVGDAFGNTIAQELLKLLDAVITWVCIWFDAIVAFGTIGIP